MEEQKQNLYILEDNSLSSASLKNFLNKRFNQTLNISIFIDGESLLKKIDAETAIVILDYDLKGERAEKLVLDIKLININTEVIVLSSDDEIGTAIDAFRKGAKSYVLKGKGDLKRIHSIVYRIMYYPVKIMQRFFGFKELVAIFIVEALCIGLVVFIGMTLLNQN